MSCEASLEISETDRDGGVGNLETDKTVIDGITVSGCLREHDFTGRMSHPSVRTRDYSVELNYINCPGKDKCRVYALLASRQVAAAILA